jgi:hypothetical protein
LGRVLILDHVPHNASRSRGATGKKDLVDVQWALAQTRSFGRKSVGHVMLTRKKDRESWLPEPVGFSVGGTEDESVFCRSDDSVSDDNGDLPPSARKALDALDTFEEAGARYKEWETDFVDSQKPNAQNQRRATASHSRSRTCKKYLCRGRTVHESL